MGVEGPLPGDAFSRLVDLALTGRASEADEAKLADLLERDPALRAEFFRLLDLDRLLPLAREGSREGERFLQSLRARALAKGSSREFLTAARQRIASATARSRRRRRLAAAAAILAVGAGLATWTFRAPDLAHLARVRGKVYVVAGEERTLVSGPRGIRAGQGVETEGPQSSAVVRYQDATTIELGSGTLCGAIEENRHGGKKVRVTRGSVAADVARQPEGRPLVFETPHGEARVLGTSLRMLVETGPKGSTRLDVNEGIVRLTRTDGRAVDVVTGYFAVAGSGVDLVARPIPPKSEPAGAPSAKSLIGRMPPNSWLPVPNTPLRRVVPSADQFPKIRGITGPDSIVSAWSGGALDTRRNRLLVWGGGHTDYYGNELYGFRLDDLSWERLTDPTPDPALGKPTNADRTPNSRATYNGLAYLAHADRFFASGGMLAGSAAVGTDITWTFDFSAKRWTNREPSGTPPPTQVRNSCSYDPGTKAVWWGDEKGLYSYDYDANRWTRHNDDLYFEVTSTVDTRRGHLVAVGSGKVFSYDLRRGVSARQEWKTTGGDRFIAKAASGLDYDPVGDRIVGWAGGAVYSLDPVTRVWTAHDPPGAPRATQNGIFGRWRYVPDYGVFVVVTGIDENVHFYKPLR